MLTEDSTALVPVTEIEETDVDFLLRRAEQEVAAAVQATHPAAVKAHYRLSGHYLDRAEASNSGS